MATLAAKDAADMLARCTAMLHSVGRMNEMSIAPSSPFPAWRSASLPLLLAAFLRTLAAMAAAFQAVVCFAAVIARQRHNLCATSKILYLLERKSCVWRDRFGLEWGGGDLYNLSVG